ncbi:MAG: transposase [Cyanobacteria bacterium P01_A01_bin.83]
MDGSNGVVFQAGGKRVKLPTLGTFRTKEAIPKCVAQTYTVSRQGNRYYVAFAINAEKYLPIKIKRQEPVGLDVNLTDGKYCVLSDGTEYAFPKPLRSAKTKLRKLQYHNRNKQLSNRRKGELVSSNARKYYGKLAKLHREIANCREDFLQKLTTELALKYQHIKVETLNIKGMMANRKLAFHIADASFYRFKTLLEQKILASGGVLESIEQWYPSSKLCSKCQTKKTDLKLKDRLYTCACGLNICRDLNSSINLQQAPEDKIVNRVGSIRINACGHDTADGHGLKQEVNTTVKQLVLPLFS